MWLYNLSKKGLLEARRPFFSLERISQGYKRLKNAT